MTSTSEQQRKNDIIIFAIIHDDVPPSALKTIYADHFHPLVTELESFTERKVKVVLASGEPYSNFAYKGEDTLQTLMKWEPLAAQYLDEAKKAGFKVDRLSKVILVTQDNMNSQYTGAALERGQASSGKFAIASLSSYLNVAHEIGHLLRAKHEDWEVQYNGWWCETYMTPRRTGIRSICYVFSPANRENIKNYLAGKD